MKRNADIGLFTVLSWFIRENGCRRRIVKRRIVFAMKHFPKVSFPFSMPSHSPFDTWRLGTMWVEMWLSASTTIMWRSWDWMLGWPAPDRRLESENKRMVEEKVAAAMEVNLAWMKLASSMWSGRWNPWISGKRMLLPLHRKTTANARRLTRRKR